MGYKTWYNNHALKHEMIMKKLSHLSYHDIIEYFRYDNMIHCEPEFCPLYKENRKCHKIDDLNCFLCGCPNFRIYNQEFKKSGCAISSGKEKITSTGIHQDCSNCTIPHQNNFIEKVFKVTWKEIMKQTLS